MAYSEAAGVYNEKLCEDGGVPTLLDAVWNGPASEEAHARALETATARTNAEEAGWAQTVSKLFEALVAKYRNERRDGPRMLSKVLDYGWKRFGDEYDSTGNSFLIDNVLGTEIAKKDPIGAGLFAKVYGFNVYGIFPDWPPLDYEGPSLVGIPGYRYETLKEWTMRIFEKLSPRQLLQFSRSVNPLNPQPNKQPRALRIVLRSGAGPQEIYEAVRKILTDHPVIWDEMVGNRNPPTLNIIKDFLISLIPDISAFAENADFEAKFKEWTDAGATDGFIIHTDFNTFGRFLENILSPTNNTWEKYLRNLETTNGPTEFDFAFLTGSISSRVLTRKLEDASQQVFVFLPQNASIETGHLMTPDTVPYGIPISSVAWVKLRQPIAGEQSELIGAAYKSYHVAQGAFFQSYPLLTEGLRGGVFSASEHAQNLFPALFGSSVPRPQNVLEAPVLTTPPSKIAAALNAVNAQANADPNAAFKQFQGLLPQYAVALAPAAPVVQRIKKRGWLTSKAAYRRTLKLSLQEIRNTLGISTARGEPVGDLETLIRLAESRALSSAELYEKVLAWRNLHAHQSAQLEQNPEIILRVLGPQSSVEEFLTVLRKALAAQRGTATATSSLPRPAQLAQELEGLMRSSKNADTLLAKLQQEPLQKRYANVWTKTARRMANLTTARNTRRKKRGFFGRMFSPKNVEYEQQVRATVGSLIQELKAEQAPQAAAPKEEPPLLTPENRGLPLRMPGVSIGGARQNRKRTRKQRRT